MVDSLLSSGPGHGVRCGMQKVETSAIVGEIHSVGLELGIKNMEMLKLYCFQPGCPTSLAQGFSSIHQLTGKDASSCCSVSHVQRRQHSVCLALRVFSCASILGAVVTLAGKCGRCRWSLSCAASVKIHDVAPDSHSS